MPLCRPALAKAISEGLGKHFGSSAPNLEDVGDAKVLNTVRYVYDPGSGWVLRVEAKQQADVAGQSRTDRTVIVVK